MAQLDLYGRMAQSGLSDTRQNGRYAVQQDAERFIPDDVLSKLDIGPNDTVLDVGCGMGLNLIPIRSIAISVEGCDHPAIIKKLQLKEGLENVTFYTGDFLKIDVPKTYSRILVYSVLHTLPDKETLFAVIDKTLSILRPDGRILFGDIPNKGAKERFLNSQRGKQFQEEWEEICQNAPQGKDVSHFVQEEDKNTVSFDDALMLEVLGYLRHRGFSSYIVAQPPCLPFGNTREDIIACGSEYECR